MEPLKKKYLNGLLNCDDDFTMVAPNEMVNASNIRFGSTDDGANMRFEKIKGTTLVFDGLEYVGGGDAFEEVGSYEDKDRQRIISFVWHNNVAAKHAIYVYDRLEDTTYTVLKEAQVEGGLGFKQTKYVDAIEIWGDLLFYTTGTGEVKVINIERGIKLNHPSYTTTAVPYVSQLKEEDIALIRRPPVYAPLATKQINSALTVDNIGDKAWKFSYIYEYIDFQQSVPGTWSLLVPFNKKGDIQNEISISLPLEEDVPQTVRKVRLIARRLDTNVTYVIRVWDKDITADATAITTHNAGTVAGDRLTFVFNNNKYIETIAPAIADKIEDSVPRNVQALQVNSDRLFLSNFTTGFAGTGISSLTIAQVKKNFASAPATTYNMYEVTAIFGFPYTNTPYYFRGFFVLKPSDNTYWVIQGAYATQGGSYPAVTTPTTPVVLQSNCGTVLGGDMLKFLFGNSITVTTFNSTARGTVQDGIVQVVNLPMIFKSNSPRSVGICFYDKFHRIIEAVVKDTNTFTPSSTFGAVSEDKTTGITCTVSNAAALTEIPEKAFYYGFIIGQPYVTQNFVEFKETNVKYGKKNADGTFTVDLTNPATSEFLVVNVGSLLKNGIGYIFQEGDLCRVAIQMTAGGQLFTKTVKIITQIGSNVLTELVDVGTISGAASQANFEIYTPLQQIESRFYYEVANKFAIANPGTGSRAYSTLSHTIPGDTPIVERLDAANSKYFAEAMSSNDLFSKFWFTNAGRPIAIFKAREVVEPNVISWSNTRFLGTEINGSSSFEVNNRQSLPINAGDVKKLINTSSLQEEGGVMVALCQRETLSLYVGRAQVSDETQFSLILKTDTVIGTVNGLRGSFGTLHPESVVFFRGNLYWFDAINGAFVRYSNNGLFDISNYKMKRVASLLAQRMQIKNTGTNIATGFRNKIVGGIDVRHEEVLWTIPKVFDTAPKGSLSDYSPASDYVYPYDLFDGASKTLVFKIQADKWMSSFSFVADGFCSCNNELYSFNAGRLYRHNTGAFNTFYGTAYKSRMAYVINEEVNQTKVFKSINIEGDTKPSWTHMRTEWPVVQSTEIVTSEWVPKETGYYSPIRNSRLSPNPAGATVNEKMIKGEPMRGQFLLVCMDFDGGGSQMNTRFFNVLHNRSYGHKQ